MTIINSIPNLLTILNLLLGCLAITLIVNNHIATGALLVFIAAIVDYLDGFFAKLLNATSNLGKQLDSLADMVTFGMVPGFVFFYLLSTSANFTTTTTLYTVIFLSPAFLITIFSALRLAKYNISNDQKSQFLGLPTPASAILVVSLPLIITKYEGSLFSALFSNIFMIYGLILLLSYLLVSKISMFTLRFSHYRVSGNELRYIYLSLSIICILIFKFVAAPVVIILYIILSFINNSFKHEIPSRN